MKFCLDITKVTIIRGNGEDKIILTGVGESPYPEMNSKKPGSYPPYLQINCRAGYAEQWLGYMGIFEFEIINR